MLAAQDDPSSRAEPRGRLPSYYAQVITPQQKEQVYQAQAEYEQQIDALEAKIEALEKKRDDAVRALLTAEQRKQVDQLAAVAKAKRDERKAKEKQAESAAATGGSAAAAPAAPARPSAKPK
jgi:Spy/CpxP family protein refolding chaperone